MSLDFNEHLTNLLMENNNKTVMAWFIKNIDREDRMGPSHGPRGEHGVHKRWITVEP